MVGTTDRREAAAEVRVERAEQADASLMLRVQADEPGAFGALYDRFAARAFGLARGIAHDRARAEEVVQEAFLSVWRSRARYDERHGTVAGWILGTVRNRAIDQRRREGRHERHSVELEEHDEAGGDVEGSAIERDEAARLRAGLARLPALQREVIGLAYFGELTSSEIADRLSVPLGTVKGRMRLGLAKLRAQPERPARRPAT